jgi:hypothetical protein
MSTNKSGTSARQIQRELGVTYKAAWRMMHRIRSMMGNKDAELKDNVEIDEAFIHPNTSKRSSARRKYGNDARRKGEVLFGTVQRGGDVKIWHVKSTGVRVLRPLILSNVKDGSQLFIAMITGRIEHYCIMVMGIEPLIMNVMNITRPRVIRRI